MRRAAIILLLIALAGCVTPPKRQVVTLPAPPGPTYADVRADVRADVLADIANDPRITVGYYALGPCKTWQTWIPKRGAIEPSEWWRAVRTERHQKLACSARHDALREQVKALLGVIRGYE